MSLIQRCWLARGISQGNVTTCDIATNRMIIRPILCIDIFYICGKICGKCIANTYVYIYIHRGLLCIMADHKRGFLLLELMLTNTMTSVHVIAPHLFPKKHLSRKPSWCQLPLSPLNKTVMSTTGRQRPSVARWHSITSVHTRWCKCICQTEKDSHSNVVLQRVWKWMRGTPVIPSVCEIIHY